MAGIHSEARTTESKESYEVDDFDYGRILNAEHMRCAISMR
jgi:hypothetical protein